MEPPIAGNSKGTDEELQALLRLVEINEIAIAIRTA